MEIFAINGVRGTLLGLSDEKGDVATILTEDNHRMEWLARGLTIRMGGTACFANYPMAGKQAKSTAKKRTLKLARRIGGIIRLSAPDKRPPFKELEALLPTTSYSVARRIFKKKGADVDRKTDRGFTLGEVIIRKDKKVGEKCCVTFQNDNLIARHGEETLAPVPDIISIMDAETALLQFGSSAFGIEEWFSPLR